MTCKANLWHSRPRLCYRVDADEVPKMERFRSCAIPCKIRRSMSIRLYNTYSHGIEEFKPLTPRVVRMYHCGPTVYDYAHIGNFRAFVLADLLRRFFEFSGYEVHQVMNITDVGHMTEDTLADGGGLDKMELAAQRLKAAKKQGVAQVENPDDPYQVAKFFTDAFLEDARALRLKIADEEQNHMPRATAHVTQMIALIEKLIAAGHAYVGADGAVYYDVTSFPGYGQLSGNTVEKLNVGAGGRISASDQATKRNPNDFLLWKPDAKHIMKWPSPWGEGYPGWHIECSAMAMSVHGVPTLDIHTGGEDNIFPHHECEIAQSTGATGEPFARYWMHTRFLLVEGEKMSKSKGNFFTARDLFAKGVDPAALRLELMRTHYRSNMNFTMKGLEDSQRMIERWRSAAGNKDAKPQAAGESEVEREFMAALSDDLNISGALGALNKWLNTGPSDVSPLVRLDAILGVLESAKSQAASDGAEIDAKCKAIDAARAAKDYATSDRLRDELAAMGIEVQISKDGTKWRRKMQLD
ncbi:MAG: cysteine--tRNA ligase [Planctomycetes bacterium]|nr:cysteine--tRNA ligase [Planctomycetota bacterium]